MPMRIHSKLLGLAGVAGLAAVAVALTIVAARVAFSETRSRRRRASSPESAREATSFITRGQSVEEVRRRPKFVRSDLKDVRPARRMVAPPSFPHDREQTHPQRKDRHPLPAGARSD